MKEIDKSGYVFDVDLAKDILIAYLLSKECKYGREIRKLCTRVLNELIEIEGEFFLKNEDGDLYFGGPEGYSGYRIQEISSWLEENKQHPSIHGSVYDLNSENKVFYEINGKLECFILMEAD